jgi:hypothetical protein
VKSGPDTTEVSSDLAMSVWKTWTCLRDSETSLPEMTGGPTVNRPAGLGERSSKKGKNHTGESEQKHIRQARLPYHPCRKAGGAYQHFRQYGRIQLEFRASLLSPMNTSG